VAWGGFDIALAIALTSTAVLTLRRSPLAEITAMVTGTLLVCDEAVTAAGVPTGWRRFTQGCYPGSTSLDPQAGRGRGRAWSCGSSDADRRVPRVLGRRLPRRLDQALS
jgi:hypothetical protein